MNLYGTVFLYILLEGYELYGNLYQCCVAPSHETFVPVAMLHSHSLESGYLYLQSLMLVISGKYKSSRRIQYFCGFFFLSGYS